MNATDLKQLGLLSIARLREVMFRNLGTKLFSLAFAFGVWLWVNAGEREVQIVHFPVELTGQPEETALVGERVDRVAVHLNGPRTLLAPIEANRRPIVLDISGLQVGKPVRLKVRESMIHVPRGVRIMQIDPSKITITLEPVRHVALPVKVKLKGEVAEGYRVNESAVKIRPKKVLVSGPESILKGMKLLETEPVDVSGAKSSFKQNVHVLAEHLTDVKPPDVVVSVPVVPQIVSRVFEQVKVIARGFPLRHKVTPPRVKLTVKGPSNVLREMNLGEEAVFVTNDGPLRREVQLPVKVDLPPGLQLVSIQPKRVTVSLLEQTEKGEKQKQEPPKDEGADEKLKRK